LSNGLQAGEFSAAPLAANLNLKTASWRLASEVTASSKELESCIHAVERVPPAGRGKAALFVPIRFVTNNKLTKFDKLLVAFDAHILAETFKRDVTHGKIIHGDGFSTLKVKISALVGEVRKVVGKISSLLTGNAPPDIILNCHCPECNYQKRCREKAIEKYDLSLLGGMTEKERKKLNNKGIFTVTQLSYTFRPRRRSKRLRDKQEKYHHSLKALAIREKKIHIVGSPELHIEGTPVYLDVEGLPDRDFYYLIGMRIRQGDSVVQHSLWADRHEDEDRIWKEFLDILATIERPVLIHYGSYETTFIKNMCSRYGAPYIPSQTSEVLKTSEVSPEKNAPLIANTIKESNAGNTLSSALNFLSVIYGHVYFPVASNGLKEIADYCGFQWSETLASGLQSIVWRDNWETSKEIAEREKLIRYNADDCEALEIVTQRINRLGHTQTENKSEDTDVVDTSKLKREYPQGFKRNTFIIPELDSINKAAYWDYQRDRVYLKTNLSLRKSSNKSPSTPNALVPNQIINCEPPTACKYCNSANIIRHSKKRKTVMDLKFMRNGIKRWIVHYIFDRYLCKDCGLTFSLEYTHWNRSRLGAGLMSYLLYQGIELRLPLETVEKSLNKLFGLELGRRTAYRIKTYASKTYESTYSSILKALCSSTLIHADETKISVEGASWYVWVFASMNEVVYFCTETREGDYTQSLLKDFKGVLVSDFYAAYDSINCPQQKCLIHLIRDINDALYKNPYDNGLKQLAEGFTSLLRPMIETIDRFGLKQYFLKKHLPSVDRFYKNILHLDLVTETAVKLRERFDKNRGKLFTFLEFDGIPWNNNNAEHAVKPFAMLRKIIKGVTSEKGLREYLILLSICETCKYRGLDFLDFLRSGEKDIDVFAASQQRRRRNTKIRQTSEVSENLGGLVVPLT